jgi:hypothetical protein
LAAPGLACGDENHAMSSLFIHHGVQGEVQITSGIIITKALCPTIMHCCCTPIGLLTVSGIHKRSINKLVTRGKPELDIFQNKNAKWWLAGK